VVIYQENWSFDGLLGKFPGADGLDSASATSMTQLDSTGTPYAHLPFNDSAHFGSQLSLANGPWDLTRYLDADSLTEDLVHRYYQEQWQINGGLNNRFASGSDAKGLSMSYVDCTNLPLGVLGAQGVVMDHFFHSAFGGSFLNHIWMVSAQTPRWPAGIPLPASKLTIFDNSGNRLNDGFLTPDSFAVNTVQPMTWPYYPGTADSVRLPVLDMATIGDRLDSANVSWAWYSGGWDSALAGHGNNADIQFQYHHQAFNYFRKFADTASSYRKTRLKDETKFFADLSSGNLPSVVWIKPEGEQNEHPGYAMLVDGQKHVKSIVDSLKNHPSVWDSTVVVITYDEHGGRWDHVAPPVEDKWGPGVRVPGVLLSPLAKHGIVDKRTYETVSILSLIEHRWNLRPLSSRDSVADPFSGAFDFQITNSIKPRKNHGHKLSLSAAPMGHLAVHRDESANAMEVEARDLQGKLLGRRTLAAGQSDATLDVGASHGFVVVQGSDATEGPAAIVH
jgi:phospholipase C